MINEERLTQTFMEYVRIDSPSGFEKDFTLHMAKELEELGLEVKFDDTTAQTGSNTGNVIARLKGKGGKPLLFSCHMDTVDPGRGIQPVLKDGVITSDGTTILGADDKSAIASLVEALRLVVEQKIPHGDIEIALSVYEEGGLRGAKAMDYSQFQSEHVFVLDTGGAVGKVAIQGPSHDILNFHIKGHASHAGSSPEKGISAIMVAAEAIAGMKLLRIDAETTANIGTIEGGLATNIVAEEAFVTAEARSLSTEKLDAQTHHMIECFEKAAQKYGASLIVDRTREYVAFHIDPQDPIVLHALAAIEKAGIPACTAAVGGGSDGNVINERTSMKAVTLSKGGINAHSLQEEISIQELVDTTKVIVELIKIYSAL